MKKSGYTSAIILAAGSGERFGGDKTTLSLGGVTPLLLCKEAFSMCDHIAVAASSNNKEYIESIMGDIPHTIVHGGETRAQSVLNALLALPKETEVALIHDSARCLIDKDVIMRAIESAYEYGSGIATLDCRDTIRNKHTLETLDRQSFVLMQTPQAFRYDEILAAYKAHVDDGFTDDCAVYAAQGYSPHFVEGSLVNQKLTFKSDETVFRRLLRQPCNMRIGYGEDTHRLVDGRRLVLCGVDVPYHKGLLGHSDADAPIHAVIDALLGAAAMGDIGRLFPSTDIKYKNISSLILLKTVINRIHDAGFHVGNIDITIVAQEPKLASLIEEMRLIVSACIGEPLDSVSVKATTPEHTGPEGRLECITARAVALLIK